MILRTSSMPAGCRTYPLLSPHVGPKHPDKSCDPTSYATPDIRLMIRRIAANSIMARKVGQDVSTTASSSVPTTANFAFHLRNHSRTTPFTAFLHSPLNWFAGTGSKSESSIHSFGNTRSRIKWTSHGASYEPRSLAYGSLKKHTSQREGQKEKEEDYIWIGGEE